VTFAEDVPFSTYPPPKVTLCRSISNKHTWMGTQQRHLARGETLLNRPITNIGSPICSGIIIHCTFSSLENAIFSNKTVCRSSQFAISTYLSKCTRFRLVPKSMTLDDLEGPLCTLFQHTCVFGAYHENRGRRCSPLTLLTFWQYKVYADIRRGSPEMGRQATVGLSKTINPRIAKEGVVSTPSTIVYKFSRNFFEL